MPVHVAEDRPAVCPDVSKPLDPDPVHDLHVDAVGFVDQYMPEAPHVRPLAQAFQGRHTQCRKPVEDLPMGIGWRLTHMEQQAPTECKQASMAAGTASSKHEMPL